MTAGSDDAARKLAADPFANVALEASAGTGKTTVLVERYLNLVAYGADPRHILAITFTRKAAGEMRARVIFELKKSSALGPETQARLFDIHVSTIDAFCLGLLREFPLEAGVDPDHELLDEIDVRRLADEAVADLLAAPEALRADLGFLVSTFGEPRLSRSLLDLLRNRLVKEEVVARFVRTRIPAELTLERTRAEMVVGLGDLLGGPSGLAELLRSGPDGPRFRAVAHALERAIDPRRARTADLEVAARYFLTEDERPRSRLAPGFSKKDFRAARDFDYHRDLVLRAAPELAEIYRRFVADRDLYVVRALFRLYRAAAARFEELKSARSGLDFTDVLQKAVGLLESRGEFALSRYRLESRYHHLLIDEFQDTNEAQWALVRALVDAWGEGAGLVQAAMAAEASQKGGGRLTEPTLFIVGDRKQSIYGWRDARVEVLEHAALHLLGLRPGGGRRLTLRRSFRATPPLLSFLNDVFAGVEKIGSDVPWSFRYDDDDHFPLPDAPPAEPSARAAPPVALAASRDVNDAAERVADEVVRLLEDDGLRPSEIAILFRSRAHYRAYEESLGRRGVPTYVYRGLGFFDSAEVQDLRALVRFLAEPDSDLRAAELLRSRFIGISDLALALLARSKTRFSELLTGKVLLDRLPSRLSVEDARACALAVSRVPGWIRESDRRPPSSVVEHVLDDTSYAACFSGRDGRQGWENLKKILELVRKAQNRGYLTFARLSSHLEVASAGEESLAVLEAIEAVNLMTIHAAKGLEFSAVFLVNLAHRTRVDAHLPRIVEATGGDYVVHALVSTEADGPDRGTEEEKRLLYVALTRARKQLVLSVDGVPEREGHPTLFDLLPASLRALFDGARGDPPELTWKPARNEHRLGVLRRAETPRAFQASRSEKPHQLELEALQAPRRASVSALSREMAGLEPDERPLDPMNVAVGAAVHRMLELELEPDEDFERVAREILPQHSSLDSEARERSSRRAAELYRELSLSPALRDVLSWGDLRREVPFSMPVDGVSVHGAIDAIVVGPRRVGVIDFKTGAPRPEHQHQMRLYVSAAEHLFPGRVVEGRLFYAGRSPVIVTTGEQLRLF